MSLIFQKVTLKDSVENYFFSAIIFLTTYKRTSIFLSRKMHFLRKFLNWMYDDPEATYASSRARAATFFVFAGIIVLILVFGLIELDYYIRHHF